MSDDEKLPAPEDSLSDRPEVTGNAGSDAAWPTTKKRGGVGGKWIFLIVVILILATQIYLVRGCQESTVDLATNTAEQIADAFSRNVTHEFLSPRPASPRTRVTSWPRSP